MIVTICLLVTVEREDYNLASTVIRFPDTSVVGDTACATFTIIDDSILELDEEFQVQITYSIYPPGVTINVTSSTTIVAIEDNEGKSKAVNKFRLVYKSVIASQTDSSYATVEQHSCI